ncbi:MAG: iron-containing alcohol dehydrogenase [Chloroflexi bacterium]|nr:iron-containing alcohol dehydrogenase [Chloroflexota bacterium]
MANTDAEPRGEFRFLLADKVAFGRGALDRLPGEVDRLGGRRALVITTRSLVREGQLLARVTQLLGHRHARTFCDVGQHTPSRDVWAAVEEARRAAADVVVSLGGGSAIDCAKLVALALGVDIASVDELNRLAHEHAHSAADFALPPHIAISTTLSASEFSSAAGITDEVRLVKGTIRHAALAPRVVLLDPAATLATPPALWLSTGMKALDHAVERVCAPDHQPLVDVVCLEAIRLLRAHLPASLDPTEAAMAARGCCQLAAWFSFFGWPNVRTGLSHVLGHQIGARFGVPHGYTSCATLPPVVRLCYSHQAPDHLASIASALDLPAGLPDVGEAVAQAIERLVARFALPSRLRDLGIPADALAGLAAATVHELIASGRTALGAAPADVERVVQAAW